MTFENPSAAWWALVAVPVLLLYLLRLNVHRETVGTGMFWQRVLPKTNPLLRRVTSLLCQLAIIALIVIGLMQLYLAPDSGSQRFFVVVDNSPSMAAGLDKDSRLSEALDVAHKLIDKMRIGDQMALYVTSPATRPICRMTSYRKQLKNALSTITTAKTAGKPWNDLIQSVADDPNSRVIFISDGCERVSLTQDSSLPIKQILVGLTTDNIALTRLSTRRGLIDPSVGEVMIEVQSFADGATDVPLVVMLDGAELARETIELTPDSVWKKTFRVSGVPSGQITARLDIQDGLRADNELSVELPPLTETFVKIIGDAPGSLLQAIAAIDRVRVADDDVSQANLHIYYNTPPPEELSVPALIISPKTDGSEWQLAENLTIAQNNSSAIVRGVSLEDAVYERIRELSPAEGASMIAYGETDSGKRVPLLYAIEESPRHIVFAADLERTDLVARDDWPKLVANAIDWLRPGAAQHVATSTTHDHDLRPTVDPRSTSAVEVMLRLPWQRWPAWYLCLALVIVLLPLEWWFYQRRIIA